MSRRRVLLILIACGIALAIGLVFLLNKHEEPAFRWGGDETGGGPYIFEDATGKRIGFEVELADYLASELGLKSDFKQGQWDKLPDLLKRGDIDVVLNGYEWSADRGEEMASTLPYYIYRLQLQARASDLTIRSWQDLRAKPGQPKKRVGVLSESAAERYVQAQFGRDVELKSYSTGVTDVMDLIEKDHDLDATVQDLPAVIHYEEQFPGLHRVGEPIQPGYYVMYVRREDEQRRRRLNKAIRTAINDGRLQRIYSRYGLWNSDQEKLKDIAARPWPPLDEHLMPAASLVLGGSAQGFGPVSLAGPLSGQQEPVRRGRGRGTWFLYAWQLLQAAGITVALSCLAMPLAIAVGLVVAVARLYGPVWISRLLGAYVEVLRGTPLLLQLYVVYFLLPSAGIRIEAFWCGVLALAINYSAYEAENYRAGLLAVPRGQMEAALALGMSKSTALWRVIVPQAVRIVIPPVTNDFIALFKDTSVCSVIAVAELTGRYNTLYNNNHEMVLELGLMAAILYLLMSYPLSLLARRLEKRFPRVVI
jgi:polar amino acid transport system substrate-binding protein